MKNKNTLTLYREKLGITQQALAEFLQVSRSRLSLAELDLRELSTQAFLPLAQLISHFEAVPAAQLSSALTSEEKQQRLALLNKLIKEMNWQLTKASRQLAKMETNYDQCLSQAYAFQAMRQQLAPSSDLPSREKQQVWLSHQEGEAWKRVEKNNVVSRMPLQLKIVALQASLQEAQRLIHTLGD